MTAIRHDEPTTAALRADVAALKRLVKDGQARIKGLEAKVSQQGHVLSETFLATQKTRRYTQKTRSDHNSLGMAYAALTERVRQLEHQMENHTHEMGGYPESGPQVCDRILAEPLPTPPPAPAPDVAEALAFLASKSADSVEEIVHDAMANWNNPAPAPDEAQALHDIRAHAINCNALLTLATGLTAETRQEFCDRLAAIERLSLSLAPPADRAVVVPTLHHNIEYFQVVEDDTEGWHVTGENHAGMKITAYHPERWDVALRAVNALAAEWTAPAGADTPGEGK